MKLSFVLYTLILVCNVYSNDLEILQAKVNVRETKKRAQLSLKLQIGGSSHIVSKKQYEADLLARIKQGLKKAILKRKKLNYHKKFTHLFITCWDDGPNEELLAMFTKIPRRRFPTITIYPRKLNLTITNQMNENITSMFQQVQASSE